MKKIREQLELLREQVNYKVEERYIQYDERSERWQESEAGEMFNDKTEELEEVVDDIVSAIANIDQFLS